MVHDANISFPRLTGIARPFRSRLAGSWALAATLLLSLDVVAAQATPSFAQRVQELRELSRFAPELGLPRLKALEPDLPHASVAEQVRYLTMLGMAHYHLGQRAEAHNVAQQLLAVGEQFQDNQARARGKLLLGYLASQQHDKTQAQQLVTEAAHLATTIDDIELRVRTMAASSDFLVQQGNLPAAMELLQTATTLARQHSDPDVLAIAANLLARLHARARQHEQGLKVLDEALAAARRSQSPGRLALIKRTEYLLAMETGQTERAEHALMDALAMERRMGASTRVAYTLLSLSDFHLRQRQYEQAANLASQALTLAQAQKSPSLMATAHMNLGLAYLYSGRSSEAKRHVELGMAGYEKIGNKTEMQVALLEYGTALERVGDLAGALKAYHRERRLSNELFAAHRQQMLLELQEKYKTDSKQREIELLRMENDVKSSELALQKKRRRLGLLLAGFAIVGALMISLMYRKLRLANARLYQKNRELQHLSLRDPLTGLYNRRHFIEHMRTMPAASIASAHAQSQGALMLLDVDHFKQINDRHGHGAGDAVLRTLAANLPGILRETDMIVRWGGEEFLAYLPGLAHDRLNEVAQRILTEVAARPISCAGHQLQVTTSIGFAPYPLALGGQMLGWERAIDLVDNALYLAKAQGRNRAVGVAAIRQPELLDPDQLIGNLEQAWQDGLVELSILDNPNTPAQAA